jgi:molybdopterin-guanine dinucleotide biosynthesis protein A
VYDRGEGAFLQDLAAFVLAGGKSTRMGTDKAFVEFEGQTLLARALEVTRAVTGDMRIVGQAAQFAAFGPVVEDAFRGCGPLGGIHAALRTSTAELNLMLAVDMPFVSVELLRFLAARAGESEAIVNVVQTDEGWQPLCGIYRPEFANVAEEALLAGRYKITALFEAGRTQIITEKELAAAGFSSEMFRNLNTPEDLAEAHDSASVRHGNSF